jgi:hypothetical protein
MARAIPYRRACVGTVAPLVRATLVIVPARRRSAWRLLSCHGCAWVAREVCLWLVTLCLRNKRVCPTDGARSLCASLAASRGRVWSVPIFPALSLFYQHTVPLGFIMCSRLPPVFGSGVLDMHQYARTRRPPSKNRPPPAPHRTPLLHRRGRRLPSARCHHNGYPDPHSR